MYRTRGVTELESYSYMTVKLSVFFARNKFVTSNFFKSVLSRHELNTHHHQGSK